MKIKWKESDIEKVEFGFFFFLVKWGKEIKNMKNTQLHKFRVHSGRQLHEWRVEIIVNSSQFWVWEGKLGLIDEGFWMNILLFYFQIIGIHLINTSW